MTRAERNSAIVAAYMAGASQQAVADRFGVSQATISRVMVAHGVPISRSQVSRRGWSPERKAAQSARSLRLWREQGFRNANLGRRTILADRPDDRALYCKIRRHYGAAYARELMGLAA